MIWEYAIEYAYGRLEAGWTWYSDTHGHYLVELPGHSMQERRMIPITKDVYSYISRREMLRMEIGAVEKELGVKEGATD